MEILWLCLIVFIVGACIGSFLNVIALRALTKESIIFPSSKCPKCGNPIKWYDNIPVFSYLFTFKGNCRSCGESVSKQYPIVEAFTACVFLAAFFIFGLTLQSILFLFTACAAIVIMITDLKKEYIFESHAWFLIVSAIAFSLSINGVENYSKPAAGLLCGVILMEITAKAAYYLVRKKEKQTENNSVDIQNSNESADNQITETSDNIDNEKFDINEYVNKNKRAFGEGDTYLAAAAGAMLGWKYFILALFIAILFQAIYILPKFLINLFEQKHLRLLISLSSFILLAIIYWIISITLTMNLYVTLAFIIVLFFFAIDTITGLKNTVNRQGFSAIAFGPALLISMFLVFFFGQNIANMILKNLFQ